MTDKQPMRPMLGVAEALTSILAAAEPLAAEGVSISEALGRFLAEPIVARRSNPPFPAAVLDGYAVRAQDLATPPATLTVVGEAAAGHAFAGSVKAGQAVRIFTGAPMPDGADAVVAQEDAQATGDKVTLDAGADPGRSVRRIGLDFRDGETLIAVGRRVDARVIGLAAAAGHAKVSVHRRPRVGVLATGDELVRPGAPMRPDQIVVSNSYTIGAMASEWGARVADLGIALDNRESLGDALNSAIAHNLDVLVTIGGASVGDHDLVASALAEHGMQLAFWRIAMRPGKPLMFGRIGRTLVLGLPGNPVSSYVCGLLFLRPLLRALQNDPNAGADPSLPAILGAAMSENDLRQDYVRARLSHAASGHLVATTFPTQDSSMSRVLADAEALIVRAPHAPAAAPGAPCRVVPLS